MSTSTQAVVIEDTLQLNAALLGSWTALLLTIVTAAAFGIGALTPPRSGSSCTGPCIAYPYSDASQFVPHDFIWMAPGILLTLLFVVLATCMHTCAERGRRHLSLITLCFASIAAAIITLDYFIELEVVQPSLLHGETNGVALFSQYNPHGIFIVLEELGYLLLSVAFLFAGAAFPVARGLSRAIRLTFLISGTLALGSFVALSWRFGLNLGFWFEIAVITIDWTALIVLGILLSIYFRHRVRGSPA